MIVKAQSTAVSLASLLVVGEEEATGASMTRDLLEITSEIMIKRTVSLLHFLVTDVVGISEEIKKMADLIQDHLLKKEPILAEGLEVVSSIMITEGAS